MQASAAAWSPADHQVEQFEVLLGGGDQLAGFVEAGQPVQPGPLAQLADCLDETVVAGQRRAGRGGSGGPPPDSR